MAYVLTTGGVFRDGVVFVPADPDNRDWVDYEAWVAAGNTPAPAAEVSVGSAVVAEARAALDASDQTVLRCYEADIAVPAEWRAYRTSLREVVSGLSTTLPARPDYPPGT